MIIPSIDIMDGQAVQLIGGKEKALEAGDPLKLAEEFGVAGEIAVIDLDAALGRGSNSEIIKQMLRIAPCRVGGGIRSVEKAREWLDAGAERIIIGTAANPEILAQLPRERVYAALDAVHGKVVIEGWQTQTDSHVQDRIEELRPYVHGFLVTFVEREGRLQGIDLDSVANLRKATGEVKLTVAGGVTTLQEIAAIDALSADCQVGMAIYTGRMTLADAVAAPLVSDRPDGLWPTIVVDESGYALGLAYSNLESLRLAFKTRRGVYCSRKRGVWVKGETSGAEQQLIRVDLDCDRDTLRFTVSQKGAGFCHKGTMSCFGDGPVISTLLNRLRERRSCAPDDPSYTARLLREPALLEAKLIEEAQELAQANDHEHAVLESADLLYFTFVTMARSGVTLAEIEDELRWRSLKISRRAGNAKKPL